MNFFNKEKPGVDLPDTDRFYMLMLNLNFEKRLKKLKSNQIRCIKQIRVTHFVSPGQNLSSQYP